MTERRFAIVTTTLGNAAEAKAMARWLLEARLAACVQITPIESVYRWEGAIEEAAEVLLSCKIATADFPAVRDAISSRHGYDLPEVVMTPIDAGSAAYLDWLARETERS